MKRLWFPRFPPRITCSSAPGTGAMHSPLLHTPTCHAAHKAAAAPKGHAADKIPWQSLSPAGTHLHPSPPHATNFSDIWSYFRHVQLAWNRPKLRNPWVKTQASSASGVAPLKIILPSLIPKWQSQGAKDGNEHYGKVFVVLVWFFFKHLLHPTRKVTLWLLQWLFLYIAAAKKKLCSVLSQSSASLSKKYHGLCSYCNCLHYS